MDFSRAEPLMLKYGITPAQIDELKALAAKLPPDLLDGTRMPIPKIPGLSEFESELLVARMFDVIAPMLGVHVPGEELLDLAGYPSMPELIRTADRRLRLRRRKGAATKIKPADAAPEIGVKDTREDRHERA